MRCPQVIGITPSWRERRERVDLEDAKREGASMKKASEYRRHAQECRRLADGMTGAQREQLLEMAATWEQLAGERSELVRRHPDLAVAGELDEEEPG